MTSYHDDEPKNDFGIGDAYYPRDRAEWRQNVEWPAEKYGGYPRADETVELPDLP